MLEAEGIIKVDHGKRMVVDIDQDFVEYYSQFITKRYWVKPSLPMHGSHITITNKKFHDSVDWDRAMDYHKQKIRFRYDHDLREGGFLKGFIMFYAKVYSEDIEHIKKDINVIEPEGYRGLHITICNLLKSGAKPSFWWPETISLKTKL